EISTRTRSPSSAVPVFEAETKTSSLSPSTVTNPNPRGFIESRPTRVPCLPPCLPPGLPPCFRCLPPGFRLLIDQESLDESFESVPNIREKNRRQVLNSVR